MVWPKDRVATVSTGAGWASSVFSGCFHASRSTSGKTTQRHGRGNCMPVAVKVGGGNQDGISPVSLSSVRADVVVRNGRRAGDGVAVFLIAYKRKVACRPAFPAAASSTRHTLGVNFRCAGYSTARRLPSNGSGPFAVRRGLTTRSSWQAAVPCPPLKRLGRTVPERRHAVCGSPLAACNSLAANGTPLRWPRA